MVTCQLHCQCQNQRIHVSYSMSLYQNQQINTTQHVFRLQCLFAPKPITWGFAVAENRVRDLISRAIQLSRQNNSTLTATSNTDRYQSSTLEIISRWPNKMEMDLRSPRRM